MGLEVVHFPCVTIEPLISDKTREMLCQAEGMVLFTSSNAVRFAHQHRSFPWSGIHACAIGSATSRALATCNQPVHLIPDPPYNSESFVTLMEAMPAQPILIIKGCGGRELIRETLSDRGWSVRCIDVYKRVRPSVNASELDNIFKRGPFDLVSVSSNEILTNLMHLTHRWQHLLLDSQLVVNSERCATLARKLQFSKPALVASPAGDEGQLRSVQLWLGQGNRLYYNSP